MTKIAGSGSGSTSQGHGSADPDPPQNVMDPQLKVYHFLRYLLMKRPGENDEWKSQKSYDTAL
jgi:hypothetical protein